MAMAYAKSAETFRHQGQSPVRYRRGFIQMNHSTSGLRSLSVGRIKSICVPVPPLAEQRRIVAELDALQAEVGALKPLQSETAAELDALHPALLDKAFKGELQL